MFLYTYIEHLEINLPLSNGLRLNIEMHPTLANCPNVVSKYTNGIPHMKSVRKYGMRNAPEILKVYTVPNIFSL